ncbi:conserved protein of unknown function [Xenorhabdus doucetiae]|uniref:Uncharacterized protein n=1 Tax=Xenorhabdus doucetiae TaxID=351671 RepID=A0A068QTX4_9GAMM|nr:conserved protein of unknown function [Xenorhabdus doucetiae]
MSHAPRETRLQILTIMKIYLFGKLLAIKETHFLMKVNFISSEWFNLFAIFLFLYQDIFSESH